mgnify:CR=1 FL=1|tara:strand:+ start:14017 stop:14724 length:708 start_codon:yes stop_codon:yes gene_type:complete
MLLGEFLEDLAVGELSKINFGDNTEEGLTEYNYKEIIKHINRGIYQIHTRFDINFAEFFLQQYSHIQFYRLTPEYAQTNTESSQPIKYIEDSPENPFDREIIKITGVFNELGEELPLNDDNAENGLFTPEIDLLQITAPSDENTLSFIYRPAPKKLLSDGDEYLSQKLDLPRIFLEALEYYILHKVVSSREYLDNANDSDKYLLMFERELARIINEDLYISDNTTNIKLTQNGWV